MAIFNSYVKLPEGNPIFGPRWYQNLLRILFGQHVVKQPNLHLCGWDSFCNLQGFIGSSVHWCSLWNWKFYEILGYTLFSDTGESCDTFSEYPSFFENVLLTAASCLYWTLQPRIWVEQSYPKKRQVDLFICAMVKRWYTGYAFHNRQSLQ